YKAEDIVKINGTIVNKGDFNENLILKYEIPQFNILKEDNLLLQKGASIDLTKELQLPDDIITGTYYIDIIQQAENEIHTKKIFNIPSSQLAINLSQMLYDTGENIMLGMKNTGGVKDIFTGTIELDDSNYFPVYAGNVTQELNPDEGTVIQIPVDNSMVSGLYKLKGVFYDTNNNQYPFAYDIVINGNEGNIDVRTEEPIYTVNSPIGIIADYTQNKGALEDGKIKLNIVKKGYYGEKDLHTKEDFLNNKYSDNNIEYMGAGGIKLSGAWNLENASNTINEKVGYTKTLSGDVSPDGKLYFCSNVLNVYDKDGNLLENNPYNINSNKIVVKENRIYYHLDYYSLNFIKTIDRNTGQLISTIKDTTGGVANFSGFAVDKNGLIYISYNSTTIKVYNGETGEYVKTMNIMGFTWLTNSTYLWIKEIKTPDMDESQEFIYSIYKDSGGNGFTSAVAKFTLDGQYIGRISEYNPSYPYENIGITKAEDVFITYVTVNISTKYYKIRKLSNINWQAGILEKDIAITGWDHHGMKVVVDDINNKLYAYNPDDSYYVFKYDLDLNLTGGFGTWLNYKKAIAGIHYGEIDRYGNFWFTDHKSYRVVKYDKDFNYLTQIGYSTLDLKNPCSLAFDSRNNIYVFNAQYRNSDVRKYDYNGKLLFNRNYFTYKGNQLKFGFYDTYKIAVDKIDRIWVLDSEYRRIPVLDNEGNTVFVIDGNEIDSSYLDTMHGIDFDSQNNAYIASLKNFIGIEIFDTNGHFVNKWQCVINGQVYTPYRVKINSNDNLFISAKIGTNHYVLKYTKDGELTDSMAVNGATLSIAFKDNDMYLFKHHSIEKWRNILNSNGEYIATFESEYNQSQWLRLFANDLKPSDSEIKYFMVSDDDTNNLFNNPWVEIVPNNLLDIKGKYSALKISMIKNNSEVSPEISDVRLQYKSPEKNYWSKDFQNVNIVQDNNWNYSSSEPTLLETGEYYLTGNVENNKGQDVTYDEYAFNVVNSGINIILSADKKAYKPDENIKISGKLCNFNDSGIPASGLLSVKKDNGDFLYSENVTVNPNETYDFSFNTNSDNSFDLVAVFNDITIKKEIVVSEPDYDITINAPEYAGYDPFGMSLIIKNKGIVEIVGDIEFSGSLNHYDIKVGETKTFDYNVSIPDDTNFVFNLTGDITGTFEKLVKLGEKAIVEFSSNNYYKEGIVEIPYAIDNNGNISVKRNFNFLIKDDNGNTKFQSDKYFEINSGDKLESSLFAYLNTGNYEVYCNSIFGEVSKNFTVLPLEKIDLSTEIMAANNGFKPIIANIKNSGGEDFEGFVIFESSLDIQRENISIATMQDIDIPFNIFIENYESDTCSYKIRVFNSSGNEVAVNEGIFDIIPSNFEIISQPHYPIYKAGKAESATFIIKNTGDKAGKATFDLTIGDFYRNSDNLILNSGESKTLVYNFDVPDDYETGSYYAEYKLGDKIGGYEFYVEGKKIDVNATLDKENYRIGDTAVLTLDISNLHPDDSLELFAWANNGNYENQIDFTLTDHKTLTFDIPINSRNDYKITYGVNLKSGKSLYLSWKYIDIFNDEIEFYTDKRLYNEGETVVCSVIVPDTGDFHIECDDFYNNDLVLNENTTLIPIKLPDYMEQGDKRIKYNYKGKDYNYYIQIRGIRIAIFDCQFDKPVYKPGEDVKVTYIVDSNTDVNIILDGTISDINKDVFNNEIHLKKGKNYIVESFNIDWQKFGTFSLDAGFYHPVNNRLLSAYSEYFNVMSEDMTPPITSIEISQPNVLKDGVYYVNDKTSITLDAKDDYSGIKETKYRILPIDNENGWLEYTESLNFTDMNSGVFTLEYYSIDNAGNSEEVKSVNFYYDDIPPIVSHNFNGVLYETANKRFINKNTL
ncbi:hypothetical protein J7L48_00775, partial [bacterium]|nr:hypothetical protein [bacterium]